MLSRPPLRSTLPAPPLVKPLLRMSEVPSKVPFVWMSRGNGAAKSVADDDRAEAGLRGRIVLEGAAGAGLEASAVARLKPPLAGMIKSPARDGGGTGEGLVAERTTVPAPDFVSDTGSGQQAAEVLGAAELLRMRVPAEEMLPPQFSITRRYPAAPGSEVSDSDPALMVVAAGKIRGCRAHRVAQGERAAALLGERERAAAAVADDAVVLKLDALLTINVAVPEPMLSMTGVCPATRVSNPPMVSVFPPAIRSVELSSPGRS